MKWRQPAFLTRAPAGMAWATADNRILCYDAGVEAAVKKERPVQPAKRTGVKSSGKDVEVRRQAIMKAVQQAGNKSVDEIASMLSISKMTAHRDIDALSKKGLVRKERGRAVAGNSLLFESNFQFRLNQNIEIKMKIAEAAARLVVPGKVIIIDDSTTTMHIVKNIIDIPSLTIITNSLSIINSVSHIKTIKLIGIGGNFDRNFQAFLGLDCERAIMEHRADIAFLSSSSVTGLTAYHQNEDVIRAKRAMMRSAEKTVFLSDHTKFSRNALTKFCDLNQFEHVFVDRNIPESEKAFLMENDVNITLV